MRGLEARCTECGAKRDSFTGMPLQVAGRPAQIGGRVASALGYLVLFGGGIAALAIGAVLQALFPAGVAGWIAGSLLLSVAVFVGLAMLLGGRRLHARGIASARDARERAINSLAARRGGTITAAEVGSALGIGEQVADELLTGMVRRADGAVLLEIDPDGRLIYLFPSLRPRVADATAPPRIASAPNDEAEIEEDEAEPPLARRRVIRRPSV